MEYENFPLNIKPISTKEEILIREVDYLPTKPNRKLQKLCPSDFGIIQINLENQSKSQKVLVSIKPKATTRRERNSTAIKTINPAENRRYRTKKDSSKSSSRLAIGDYPFLTAHLSADDSNSRASIEHDILPTKNSKQLQDTSRTCISSASHLSQCPRVKNPLINKNKRRFSEKCYVCHQLNMNLPKLDVQVDKSTAPNKVDVATQIISNTISEGTTLPSLINKLNKRFDSLERKVLDHEVVFRALDPRIMVSSSDEEHGYSNHRRVRHKRRRRCSYVQQYSHVPETSAFQRYAQQAPPLSPSKATTIEKEHNSEQYGRHFTTYDGITARGRRQCASMPGKRDDIPKLAAERVHKIRHKLNPVRDYRLMDTVHYLAQGEFAPRDDGIKLTPSREAVLSDIIYEDVCRTHWPNTRLGRRGHAERGGPCELQRHIDGLLRERVAHVERRRRRHYRVVKLNHRHENINNRPLGKIGDIIVASHKNGRENERASGSDFCPGIEIIHDRRYEQSPCRSHRSHDRLHVIEARHRRQEQTDENSPGPSCVKSPPYRKPAYCYHHTLARPGDRFDYVSNSKNIGEQHSAYASDGNTSGRKPKIPRLVVKKDGNLRKSKEEPNLEHYIVLPTLVIRTPSNMKRQKKFNELYHKILNVQLNKDKKDIGLNINVTPSNSAEGFSKKMV